MSRALFVQPFKGYASDSVTRPLKVAELVHRDSSFVRDCELIKRKIAADFATASEQVKAFMIVRPIYDAQQSWDFERYVIKNVKATAKFAESFLD